MKLMTPLIVLTVTVVAVLTALVQAGPVQAAERLSVEKYVDYFDRIAFRSEYSSGTVRRHINWNNWQPDLREDLAHLFQDIKRRVCGIASAGFPLFSV